MSTRENFRNVVLEAINGALAQNLNPVEIYGEMQILTMHIQVQCEMNIHQMIMMANQARAEEAAKAAEAKTEE